LWIGATLLTLFAAVGGVLFAMKARPVLRRCRVCGEVPESGDLCQTCRHEAAEAARCAASARAEQQRAQQEEQRRLSEREEEQRRVKTRYEEEAPLRQREEARQQEEAYQRKMDKQREEEKADTQRSLAAVASSELFDPYVVLGVPRDASKEVISAAYQEAKLKYDPDLLTHLSVEVQEHLKARAQAVDLAHQKLTE
jgi:flagellar biosynthesis GTPase FlhF